MKVGVPSAQPVRTPGPAIFENVPEESALPKSCPSFEAEDSLVDSLDRVLGRVASISTKRGRRAWALVGEGVEGEMGH